MLLSERYLRHRYKKGYEEGLAEGRRLAKEFAKGLAEGRKEGLAVGLAAGKAQERSKWEEWTRQLMEEGLLPPDIEVPPPDSDGKKKDS